MKIYLILGHPDRNSFNGRIADAYEQRARQTGHEIRRHDLGALSYDPVLRHGYREIQQLEPDLVRAMENVLWCDKLVIVYPMWWGSMPALLKGFFDRLFLPGFAFHYHEKDPWWDKLLKGRQAHVITTSDAPVPWIWLEYHNADRHTIDNAILKFCGFKPITFSRIGRMKYLNDQQREERLEKILHNEFGPSRLSEAVPRNDDAVASSIEEC